MLEGLAAWVLNSYLGRYVENLNTDQLSVGLLKGDVELEGLPLKREALRALDLPIEVKSGFIGKIRLHIPLTCLRSEPWTISMEQLYLVAGPIPPGDFDEEREDQAIEERKLEKLDRMEAKWRSDQEAKLEASYYASSYTSWVSYGTSVVSSILENVQVKIKDVHIRFEDEFTDPKRPLAWGFTLESLMAQSSDEQWVPQFRSSTEGTKFKLVKLHRLSVYWDVAEDVTLIGGLKFPEMANTMKRMCETDHRHNYVVEPVSFEARLRRNTSSMQSKSSPRFVCDFILEKLPIFLSEEQYESMVVWIYEFDRLSRARPFQRWRPKVAVHGHAREWWCFAAKPHICEHRRRHQNRNWPFLLQRAQNNVLYVKAYTEYLINPVTCPAALKNYKDTMEREVPFDELKLLREIAIERISAVEEEARMKEETMIHANRTGLLQRWFPQWGGWYPATKEEEPVKDRANVVETAPTQHLEDEILDVLNDIEDNGVFRKDAILASVNFVLKCGTFTLCSMLNRRGQLEENQRNELFELAFADMQFLMELRPNTSSSLYQLCLGTLHLRDKSMEASLFPTLIEPQMRETLKPAIQRQNIPVSLVSKYLPKFPWSSGHATTSSSSSSSSSSSIVAEKPSKEEPLFHVTYETKPRRSTADFRLHVKSRSLDIVYNESSLKRLIGFFTWPYLQKPSLHHGLWSSLGHVEQQQPLVTVAKNRYEQLKRQTQMELRKNWDQILEGEQKFTQRWDIDLDISAPQIILPEHFFTEDTTIVVCDFGRFQFRTSSAKVLPEKPSSESDGEENFKTPCSTPPDVTDELDVPTSLQSAAMSTSTTETFSQCDITDATLHQRMYDSYSLDLRDLRVLVYKAKSDWKSAYHQATSTMHVVDRFSVSLLLERRVIHTLDDQWPSATLSGSLPKLVVHMNEQKLQALKVWQKLLKTSTAPWTTHHPSTANSPTDSPLATLDEDLDMTPTKESTLPESRLLVMQFSVGQMCLDLQSRGQSVAELQVTGINSTFTMRPHDTAVSLTVYGLLLVDALQTFGPDFELLVASHKNVSIDSVSGSLRDSEPNSPTSPASPTMTESHAQDATSHLAINAVLKHIHEFDCPKSPPILRNVRATSWPSRASECCESEALIAIEFVRLHAPKTTDSMGPASNVASVHFNNLDIIANQRTIVELLGFARQAFPEGMSGVSDDHFDCVHDERTSNSELARDKATTPANDKSAVHLELTFDFHRLSVLFLKSVSVGEMAVAQKVATATMTGACIRAMIGSTLEVDGSLGSLQVLDLMSEGAKHSRIMSVGRDLLLEKQWISLVDRLQADLYRNVQEGGCAPKSRDTLEKAFVFKVTSSRTNPPDEEKVSLIVRMASVRYVHSLRFLVDLSSCASEFSHYMADLAGSVKIAAAEVAELCLEVDVKLDILLDSPVIVIPETLSSDNVLIAHLGRISISNSAIESVHWNDDDSDGVFADVVKSERISIEVRDMSLFSRDVGENLHPAISTLKKPVTIVDEDFKGFPILHKTIVVLTVDRLQGTGLRPPKILHDPPSSFEEPRNQSNYLDKIQSFFNICGRVVSPLKVSLSKKQYEQIFKTLDSTTHVYASNVNNATVASTDSITATKLDKRTIESQVDHCYSLKAKFELPKLTVILFGDLGEMERPLVSLSFQEFLVDYEKHHPSMSSATVTLRTLIMEDLLEDPDSKHRFLMLSSAPKNKKRGVTKTRYLSSSCPNLSNFHPQLVATSTSLPDRLTTESVFQNLHRIREKRLFGGYVHQRQRQSSVQSVPYDECPRTPPPSPLGTKNDAKADSPDSDALVTVKILTVEKMCSDSADELNLHTKRYVDVTFNCLDTIVNLHSWVVVLDFFGIGEPSSSSAVGQTIIATVKRDDHSCTDTHQNPVAVGHEDTKNVAIMTTEMEIEVRSLTLVFNKEEYELARANVSKFVARVLQTQDHVSVQGKLGSMSLLDLTPNGHMYREKFAMVGDEALDFQIIKYYYDRNSSFAAEPGQHDAKIKLNMSSVHYVHTNRFSAEICAFFLHFHQLQNLMAKFRADATGTGWTNEDDDALFTQPSARVKLDICINSLVIVVPISFCSSEVLVVDLGLMKLSNEFLNAGSEGTISVVRNSHTCNPDSEMDDDDATRSSSKIPDIMTRAIYGCLNVAGGPCVLDVIHIVLMDMDLCLAERLERDSSYFTDVQADLQFASFVFRKKSGSLLTETCILNLQMERNLHYAFDHSVADVSVHGILSTVHCMLDLHQYKVIRGILKYNLGEALEEFKLPKAVTTKTKSPVYRSMAANVKSWPQLSCHLDLVNVIVEVHQRHASPPHRSAKPLAKVNLFKSRLTYERYANNCVDVDLLSQEILVSDIRFRDGLSRSKNVHTSILEPTKGSQPDVLQAEIHFRMTDELTRATVLLNNMRVIALLDWWTSVLDFVCTDIDSFHRGAFGSMKSTLLAGDTIASKQTMSTVSDGVITKVIVGGGCRDAIGGGGGGLTPVSPFELKINVTETGIVVVEDPSLRDTDAVMLQATAVVSYRPGAPDKPLSCSLQRLEVFSCVLGLEEDTALSIVDPVTVTVELLVKHSPDGGRGLLDSMEVHHTLEVSMQDLSVRLSYHDVQLFLRLLDSLPKQAPFLSRGSTYPIVQDSDLILSIQASENVKRLTSQISKLEVLGFKQGDCLKALEACGDKLDHAALWLTLHATPLSSPNTMSPIEVQQNDGDNENKYSCELLGIRDLEVHVNHFSLCLIDDCRDADVPLLELTLDDVRLQQSLGSYRSTKGRALFLVQGDFYNRNLSGWEPFLEPWKGDVAWRKNPPTVNDSDAFTVSVEVTGRDVLDVNVTSVLLDLYRNVKANWTEDYYGGGGGSHYRHQRSPFVPFALRNDTGSNLKFATVTSNHEQLTSAMQFSGGAGGGGLYGGQKKTNWTDVGPSEVVPFTFEGRMRTRHRDTHDFKVHQLIVGVEGWQQVAPVSVDKVGVFFRHANPATTSRSALAARIVFAVTLEGSAQKVVTVRSALTLVNRLDVPIEVRLENSMLRVGATLTVNVQPAQVYPIPLTFVSAHIFARPMGEPPLLYCNNAIQWQHVSRPGEVQEAKYSCTPTSTRPNARHFRFCARVRRENYPSSSTVVTTHPQQQQQPLQQMSSASSFAHQIGHQITLLPPVVLENLLPYELTYEVRSCRDTCGTIKEGREANLHFVDLSDTFYVSLSFDNFRMVNDLVVPNGSTGFAAVLQAKDIRDRTLLLQVRATGRPTGSSIRISISAPYWLVNRTGLPLIIRQEGVGEAAAGQFSEHEMARSVAPLLFSFSDVEAPALCSMRLGRSVHETQGGEPQWCHHFHLQTSTACVRRLHVSANAVVDSYANRPDWVYGIGIDVRRGSGRHADVHIVTFTPRFQLDNCSSLKLEFAQKCALAMGQSMDDCSYHWRLLAMPHCMLPFHWPRPDRDQLLCVRTASLDGCGWSGGFAIERVDSFHVNMRDANGVPTFLRVQVVLQGATYVVVFADADNATPSPLRLDNLSEVPVTCHQSGVENVERLRLCLRPHTSVPYAWDEPTLSQAITCIAPGGCNASYSITTLGESKIQLSYENFIYVAFTETFAASNSCATTRYGSSQLGGDLTYDTRELVLDVPQGTRVISTRKEPGRRSQLWRMTSGGMLQHEGSSPPTRGGSKRSSQMNLDALVLDIEDMAPKPREYVRLVLRKPDKRRALTQTWQFTSDGRLCCKLTTNSLFVQPRDGFHGLRSGAEVVLGPYQPVQYMLTKTGVPVEQVVGRQRLWSGSGLLGIKVITDGPTRVLQIIDMRQKLNSSDLEQRFKEANCVTAPRKIFQLQVAIRLPCGLGLSLVSHSPAPEELIYVRLINILLEVTRSSTEEKLDGNIGCVQVDNQLTDAECPVLLFVSPLPPPPNHGGLEREVEELEPAVQFTVHRVLSRHSNIDLFKNFMVNVKNLTSQVEERLLWKLCQFCDIFGDGGGELDDVTSNGGASTYDLADNAGRRSGGELARAAASVALARRYYFDVLKLKLHQVRLSMITSRGLHEELRAIKRRSGLLTLVRFEDALIELDPFVRTHTFETGQFLVNAVLQHYRDELKGQAAKILGAVDFLGNPLGLVNDVSEGLSGFLIEGNVGGLLKNVTHGLSNSAAKVTGTISDGLGSVTMDARHREQRRRLQQQSTEGGGGSSERLVAGLKGLGFGLYGGVTSLVVQTYEGAANDGVTGIITGFGKGLIGTFTKPAVGMLDLATSAASAVRDTSRSSHHQVPYRIRMRRVCVGPTGLLPQYSVEKSRGQELLYSLNDKDYSEVFIGCEPLGYSRDSLYAVISLRKVYFLSQSQSAMTTTTTMTTNPFGTTECVLTIPLGDLYNCKVVKETAGLRATCLELTTRAAGTAAGGSATIFCNRPKVVCDTEAIALKVARQINYAKRMSDELVHTLSTIGGDLSDEAGYSS